MLLSGAAIHAVVGGTRGRVQRLVGEPRRDRSSHLQDAQPDGEILHAFPLPCQVEHLPERQHEQAWLAHAACGAKGHQKH